MHNFLINCSPFIYCKYFVRCAYFIVDIYSIRGAIAICVSILDNIATVVCSVHGLFFWYWFQCGISISKVINRKKKNCAQNQIRFTLFWILHKHSIGSVDWNNKIDADCHFQLIGSWSKKATNLCSDTYGWSHVHALAVKWYHLTCFPPFSCVRLIFLFRYFHRLKIYWLLSSSPFLLVILFIIIVTRWASVKLNDFQAIDMFEWVLAVFHGTKKQKNIYNKTRAHKNTELHNKMWVFFFHKHLPLFGFAVARSTTPMYFCILVKSSNSSKYVCFYTSFFLFALFFILFTYLWRK